MHTNYVLFCGFKNCCIKTVKKPFILYNCGEVLGDALWNQMQWVVFDA